MNVELLREIAEVIQEKPEGFNMRVFNAETECGTTHCIGGWAEKLSGKEASEALGISYMESNNLFYIDGEMDEEGIEVGGWPQQFRGVPDSWSPTPAQAAARIEHFIATEGRE